MNTKTQISKKKIILYYSLAIVLPSIILGALAFRGVINDQALKEKESRRQLTEAGTNIISAFDLLIINTEEQFLNNSVLTSTPQLESNFFEDSIQSEFLSERSEIQGIFFIQATGKVQLLKSGLLFFPDGTISEQNSASNTNFNKKFAKGWEYEFQEKNYQKALKYYQDLINKKTNNQTNASLLIIIARIQKKLLNDSDAITAYRLMFQNYSLNRLNGGTPLGVVALMESARLYLSLGDTLNSLKSTHQLIELTLKSHWELEISQYNQLLSAANEILEIGGNSTKIACTDLTVQIKSLIKQLTLFADKSRRLLVFHDRSETVLNEFGVKTYVSSSDFRTFINIDGNTTYFSVFLGTEKGQWGIIYDLSHFLNQLNKTTIPNENKQSDFHWKLFNEVGELLLQSSEVMPEELKITSIFPSQLPSWSIVLFKESSSIINAFFRASQGVFIYIFLLIIIVLALGLFFTLQIINKELSLSKMKSDFISTVSHEFKSPLTSIRQMSEMLFNERIDTESRKKEYYAIMLEQSERLSHLIDNILDFSRIEEGKKAFRFEKTKLSELIIDVKSAFQNRIVNEGFTVSSKIPKTLPEIAIDKEAIQQVIYNLLDNAYKYSGDSKTIEITAELAGDFVKISIKDFGIGIQEEDQHKIFNHFFRGGNELTRSVKGSGIGLTIVKKIVEAHNGTVTLESIFGKGSIFHVTLPVDIKTEV